MTTLKLVNNRKSEADPITLLLVGDNTGSLGGISLDTITDLSNVPQSTITFDQIKTARLYVGLGLSDNPPRETGDTYFGWIEFTQTGPAAPVWINLSNVDMSGLPLALSGTTTEGKTFSLGVDTPMVGSAKHPGLLDKAKALPADDSAFVVTKSGQTKVLSPTLKPEAYDPYTSYLKELTGARAKLAIRSDVPKAGSAKTFTGHFENPVGEDDPILKMTSAQGDTYVIKKKDLTTAILYRCDGGKIIYNGKSEPQNRTPKNDPTGNPDEQIITNSVFRNICIGFNEGYFTANGANQSDQFAGQTPFASGFGNPYAKLIHETTNSYGFPYADSNLKVLITADPSKSVTLTILKDNESFGYSKHPGGLTPNLPSTGTYQFGIGTGSGALGPIRINNWLYTAGDDGSFGGYLPDLTDWTRMEFLGAGPDCYIWVRNGDIECGKALSAPPTWVKDVATWPSNLAWVSGQSSPAKPIRV